MSKILKTVFDYVLVGTKALLAFLAILYNTLFWFYIYFVIDVIISIYQKWQEGIDRDLSQENIDNLTSSSKKLQIKFEKLAQSQQKYERERKIKEDSLKFLDKLISEGLIREKDLLSLAGTSEYFQLFIYSASLNKLSGSLELERPRRQYPFFLEKLGFVRLGKNSSFFLINKNRFKDEKLKNIKDLKRFLMYHFSRIRNKEWNDFLGQIEQKNKKEYLRFRAKSYKEWGFLKYNFLLTETNMNPTNIGFVDGEYVGLGIVSRNKIINSQILEKANLGRIELSKQLKVKIKKIIEKLDISLLLEGITKIDKNTIDLKQDILKENLGIENVIDFYGVNIDDLKEELAKIGLDKDKSKKIAKQIIETTEIYKKALIELNITI